jgi:hypothetical protein
MPSFKISKRLFTISKTAKSSVAKMARPAMILTLPDNVNWALTIMPINPMPVAKRRCQPKRSFKKIPANRVIKMGVVKPMVVTVGKGNEITLNPQGIMANANNPPRTPCTQKCLVIYFFGLIRIKGKKNNAVNKNRKNNTLNPGKSVPDNLQAKSLNYTRLLTKSKFFKNSLLYV